MAVVDIPWPTSALPGRRPGEGQGDLINAYAVKVGEQVKIRRTPGLKRVYQLPSPTGRTPRGQHATNTVLLHIWNTDIYSMALNGTTSHITGTITGTDPVTVASNLQAVPQVVIVSTLATQIIDMNTATLASYPDGDLGSVTSVEYFAGYFVFTRTSGEMVVSGLQNTSIDPLSIAKAEYSSDFLLRVKAYGASLLAFGTKSIEVWRDVGTSPFPFARQSAIDVGLLGKWCVNGGSNVWGSGICFVASDFTVRMLDGYDPKVISNDDVSGDVFTYRDRVDSIETQVYEFEQQSIFQVRTVDWCWEYNITSGTWHRRDSWEQATSRGRFGCVFNSRWYQQDALSGAIHEVDPFTYTEDGAPLRFRAESAPVKDFPASIRVPVVDIDMSVALGRLGTPSPFQTDPAVMVSWSHDGGATWANPLARALGQEGKYGTKVSVRNLGRTTHHGFRLRVEVVDPVPAVLVRAVSTRTRPAMPKQVL